MDRTKVTKCSMEGLYIIESGCYRVGTECFVETYNQQVLKEAGLDVRFVQDNQSVSVKGVLRGLHFQKQYPQGKLVRVVEGAVFDVAVDMRPNSVTYGKWYGVELSDQNNKQFYVGEGFAHGFFVLSDVAKFCYKVTEFWHPEDEVGIPWNDPDIGIIWPIQRGQQPIVAEKDKYYESFWALNKKRGLQ